MRGVALAVGVMSVCAGCAVVPPTVGDPVSVADVVLKIKRDLQAYQVYDADAVLVQPRDDTCRGAVSFAIEKVKVSLTTKTEEGASVSAGATVLLGDVRVGPSFDAAQRVRGTQTLTFSLYPAPVQARGTGVASPSIDADQFPIAAALQRLRNGLLEASRQAPCVSLLPHDDDGKETRGDAGTVDFDFAVINDRSGGAGIKLLMVAASGEGSTHREAANSITVTFRPRAGSVGLR